MASVEKYLPVNDFSEPMPVGPCEASCLRHPMPPPPRMSELADMPPWPLTLDEAIQIGLTNNRVISEAGGRMVASSASVRSAFDPAIVRTDAAHGPEAALSAFDFQIESGLVWNGGGRRVGGGLSPGPFGVFAQPETMATLGVSKTMSTGTRLQIGGVGGYDSQLATGSYAAFGAELRHPLARGAGMDFNSIAGPYGRPGNYRGVRIGQIDTDKAHLELERAVTGLLLDVASTYWELSSAYQNLQSKRANLEYARQSWERERRRVAEQASPPDFEATARQQYYTAKAAVDNAIGGMATDGTGVYGVETRLRVLLGLAVSDGRLIRPVTDPLEADFRFDWNESLMIAEIRRLELRQQDAELQQCELELRAAKNLAWPQVDMVGQFRRLAGDPDDENPLFGEALQGWQVGVEMQRAWGNRREKAAVRNAELKLRRAHAVRQQRQQQIAGQLRMAFTDLDRAYQVTQSLAIGREAAQERLRAEAERHAAGDTHIERVLESQTRAAAADTAYLRSVLDFNLAFIQLHAARGSLLDLFGVGVLESADDDEWMFAHHGPSVYTVDPTRTGSTDLGSIFPVKETRP